MHAEMAKKRDAEGRLFFSFRTDDETRVKAEIAERVAKMKTMDKKLQGS
jgi:hypothetical protein